MPEQPPAIAPVYRYFTADLLTNEIISEIPLRGVSWERALKGAGRFSGQIPVTEETDSIGLYDVTMPGQTALYVVRNGVCVWGGIIWARDYSLNSKELSISASEFQSYFYHRKVWKSWNHKFGATVFWVGEESLSWLESRRNWSKNPNPTGSGNTTQWSPRWSWGRTWQAAGGVDGSRSVTLTSTVAGAVGLSGRGFDVMTNPDVAPPTSADVKSVPVEAGEFLSFSVYLKPSFGSTTNIFYRIHDGSGVWLTAASSMSTTTTPSGVWTRVEGSISVPTNGFIVFSVQSTATESFPIGATLVYSKMLIEKSPSVRSWFDGATTAPGDSSVRYSWEGVDGDGYSVLENRVGEPAFRVSFDNGSDVLVRPGSTVKLEFEDSGNIAYDGQYRVATTPAPTKDGFTLVGGSAVADVVSAGASGLWDIYKTKEAHRFNTGDIVRIVMTSVDGVIFPEPYTSTVAVDVPPGLGSNVFRVARTSSANAPDVVVDGTASRPLPVGTYRNTTVTVRQDTYDYIRTLIDAMFVDFVGVDFPNVYLEPGLSTPIDVVQKEAYGGHHIVKTATPHGVAPGQAVQITNVDRLFNGEYEVTDTPAPDTLVYKGGGSVPITPVTPRSASVARISLTNGLARLDTTSNHGYLPGQHIDVHIGEPYGEFSGTWEIHSIPSPTSFCFKIPSSSTYATTDLPYATVTRSAVVNQVTRVEVKDSSVTLQLRDEPTYLVGQSIAVSGVNRRLSIKEKAYDSVSGVASLQTDEPHGLSVGDSITVDGIQDSSVGVSREYSGGVHRTITARPHNFRPGDVVSVDGVDIFKMREYSISGGVATISHGGSNNIAVGSTVTIEDLLDEVGISSRSLASGVATITTSSNHNFSVNDSVYIEGLSDTYRVSSKEVIDGVVILTTDRPHNVQVGQKVVVAGVGVPYNGTEIEVEEATATRIVYAIDQKYWEENGDSYARKGEKLELPMTVPQSKASGTITSVDSYYNGEYVITSRTNRSFQFWRSGNDMASAPATGAGVRVTGHNSLNGTHTVTSRTASTISFSTASADSKAKKVLVLEDEEAPKASMTSPSIFSGTRTVATVTASSLTFVGSVSGVSECETDITIKKQSVFNGTRIITSTPASDRIQFSLPGITSSVYEEATNNKSYITSALYNGTYTITSVDKRERTISYTISGAKTFGSKSVLTHGTSAVRPTAIISTFGPFPGSAGVGIEYDTQRYAGVDVQPTSYRGFELKSVGEILETYADTLNGFEYRIDCSYDADADRFKRTFVLVPINLPDNAEGVSVSPASRFGADKLVFEYPGGSITDMSISESAEDSATRFFAVGTTSLGPDAGPDMGVATATDMLRGDRGRAWPLLDASETIDGVERKEILYGYAERYLSEISQPYATISVSVNGSIPPYVDSYVPGDWCSLIIKDKFIQMRMENDLEPRDDVLVRKIDSFQVNVPDGVTFPETVQLNLVAEWEIDNVK